MDRSGRAAFSSAPLEVQPEREPNLLAFARFLDPPKHQAEFAVGLKSTEWNLYVQGYAVLSESFCPGTLYLELVTCAIKILNPELRVDANLGIDDLHMMSPLGMATDRVILLRV